MEMKYNKLCILGAASGIAGAIFYSMLPFLPPLALTLGIIGLRKFNSEFEKGKGMGIVAIIFGLIYCFELVASYYLA